jgi:hypothetical protein
MREGEAGPEKVLHEGDVFVFVVVFELIRCHLGVAIYEHYDRVSHFEDSDRIRGCFDVSGGKSEGKMDSGNDESLEQSEERSQERNLADLIRRSRNVGASHYMSS